MTRRQRAQRNAHIIALFTRKREPLECKQIARRLHVNVETVYKIVKPRRRRLTK